MGKRERERQRQRMTDIQYDRYSFTQGKKRQSDDRQKMKK